MIGIFNFHIGYLGYVCLLDLINLGPSAGKTTAVATSETLVGSSSKVNSPIIIKQKKGSTVEELDEIMENIDLEEFLGYSNRSSEENFDRSHKYS
jgi:hypothetical protein